MLKLIVEAKVWPFQEVHNYQVYLVPKNKETILKELSVDKNIISNWFKTGNTWNGRTYVQVVAKIRQVPVSAACILQAPDRNANAKKVITFLRSTNLHFQLLILKHA